MRNLAVVAGLSIMLVPALAVAQVLHDFSATPVDGNYPLGSVIMDGAGALYGTTYIGGDAIDPEGYPFGTVYKLTPPVSGHGQWVEQVLHNFPQSVEDGDSPHGNLVMDAAGALYGTTGGGGSSSQGVIYKLTPPAEGSAVWEETILHTFSLAGGQDPMAGLIEGPDGALYGTTFSGGSTPTVMYGMGVVFKLTPPPVGLTDWTYQVLHVFVPDGIDGYYPISRLAMDGGGNLFGVSQNSSVSSDNGGTVFEVSPPPVGQTAWSERVIMNFSKLSLGKSPRGGLAIDAAGVLYGNTADGGTAPCRCGTAYTLTRLMDGIYHYTLLYSFSGTPDGAGSGADVTLDQAGNVFGTTGVGGVTSSRCATGCGTVYKLTRPSAGQANWTETEFASPDPHYGKQPQAGVLVGGDGRIFGTTSAGGRNMGGSVFEVPAQN